MKNIILILLACLSMTACKKEEISLSADSVYNLPSKWENQDGNKMHLADLKGKTVVMVMIYTSCKTACPRLTIKMREIENKIGSYDPNDIRFVLVSIDPEVDTPKKMKEYLANNKFGGQQWLFLRSDEEHTRELANALAVKYKQITPVEFSHSNIITVFSKNGEMAFQKEGLDIDVDATVSEIKKQLD